LNGELRGVGEDLAGGKCSSEGPEDVGCCIANAGAYRLSTTLDVEEQGLRVWSVLGGLCNGIETNPQNTLEKLSDERRWYPIPPRQLSKSETGTLPRVLDVTLVE
jgi:hypothetical protein